MTVLQSLLNVFLVMRKEEQMLSASISSSLAALGPLPTESDWSRPRQSTGETNSGLELPILSAQEDEPPFQDCRGTGEIRPACHQISLPPRDQALSLPPSNTQRALWHFRPFITWILKLFNLPAHL